MSIHTFQDVNKKYTLSVKSEFLSVCPNPHELSHFDLLSKHHLYKYLHNPEAPAVVPHEHNPNRQDNSPQFWLEGRYMLKENADLNTKMQHNWDFKQKLEAKLVET